MFLLRYLVRLCQNVPEIAQKLSILKSNGRIFIFHVSLDSLYSTLVFYAIDAVYAYASFNRQATPVQLCKTFMQHIINVNIRILLCRNVAEKIA